MTSALEIAANAVTTVSILLASRNSIHTWWTGIVGCALFVVVFQSSQLYADVALQLFFVATSVLGWRLWLRGDHGRPLAQRRRHVGQAYRLVRRSSIRPRDAGHRDR